MDGVGALLAELNKVSEDNIPPGAVCEGVIVRAGRGNLSVQVGRLYLDKEDVRLNPYYSYTWLKDEGGPTYLRAGDRVILLTIDAQTYYLICKVVTCT